VAIWQPTRLLGVVLLPTSHTTCTEPATAAAAGRGVPAPSAKKGDESPCPFAQQPDECAASVHGARPSAEAIIRTAVNQRFGPVQSLTPEARQREVTERETLASAIFRLFSIGLEHTPAWPHPKVRDKDVEEVATILRRLALVRGVPLTMLVSHAAAKAAGDKNVAAHRADPFQIRHLLSFYRNIPSTWLDASQIARLQGALARRDDETVGRWFASVSSHTDRLPKETPAFLLNLLLKQCTAGSCDLAVFAFEQAVLSVRLHGALGWENTRIFYALLKRLSGAASTAFDDYLTRAELESAIRLHEESGDEVQLVHFLGLRERFDEEVLGKLATTINAIAQQRDAAASDERTVAPTPTFISPPVRRFPNLLRIFQAA
jgi:hypothetical protein